MPAGVAVGLVAGGLSAYGSYKQQQEQNKYLQQASQMLSPQALMRNMGMLNPGLYYGMTGQQMGDYTPGGYGQAIRNIAQDPGYIDPTLKNAPLQASAQRGQQDLIAAQGMLGRANMRGGLGSAYALANQAAQTQRDVGIHQEYGLWREAQRRADLDWLQRQWQTALGQAGGFAGQQGQYIAGQTAPTSWPTYMSNALTSGLSAYGQLGGQGWGQGRQYPQQPGGPTNWNQQLWGESPIQTG